MTVQLSKTEDVKVQTAFLLSNSKPMQPGFSARIFHWNRLDRSDGVKLGKVGRVGGGCQQPVHSLPDD